MSLTEAEARRLADLVAERLAGRLADQVVQRVGDRLAKRLIPPGADLLTVPQAYTFLGCSEAWLYRLKKRYDDFPKPLKLAGYRRTYYRRAELEEWRGCHEEPEA